METELLYINQIRRFQPSCLQEENDQRVILDFVTKNPTLALSRQSEFAHMTSSGFILNRSMDKALMIYHNIYDTWAWTGGHADGDTDLLYTALREAREETGVEELIPVSEEILSLDVLPVWGHMKNGSYVSAHLHLSAAYALLADESAPTRHREGENSGVMWIPTEELSRYCTEREPVILALYQKLINRARELKCNGLRGDN